MIVVPLARYSLEAAVLDTNVGGMLTYPVADVLVAQGTPVVFAADSGVNALADRFRGLPDLEKPFSLSAFEEALRIVLSASPCELSAR
jgi:hypothetical protein